MVHSSVVKQFLIFIGHDTTPLAIRRPAASTLEQGPGPQPQGRPQADESERTFLLRAAASAAVVAWNDHPPEGGMQPAHAAMGRTLTRACQRLDTATCVCCLGGVSRSVCCRGGDSDNERTGACTPQHTRMHRTHGYTHASTHTHTHERCRWGDSDDERTELTGNGSDGRRGMAMGQFLHRGVNNTLAHTGRGRWRSDR